MKYELFSMVDASNGIDSILRVWQTPDSCWDFVRGKKKCVVTFVGSADQWKLPEGKSASHCLCAILNRIWEEHSRSEGAQPSTTSDERSCAKQPEVASPPRESGYDPIQEAGEESFPPSDPPSWTSATI